MTKEELVNLYKNSGRNIHVSELYCSCDNTNVIDFTHSKVCVVHEPTNRSILEIEKDDSLLRYYNFFVYELNRLNAYGDRFIAMPDHPGIIFNYTLCDEKSMLHLLDSVIQEYELTCKQVKQKNKEWKLKKDFA